MMRTTMTMAQWRQRFETIRDDRDAWTLRDGRPCRRLVARQDKTRQEETRREERLGEG